MLIKNAKREHRKITDGDVDEARLPDLGHIRVQGISHAGFRQDKRALDAVSEISLLRRKLGQKMALDSKKGTGDMAGGADDDVVPAPCKILLCKCFPLCKGMIGGADTGDGDRTELAEIKLDLPLGVQNAKGGMDLSVYHLSQKRGEGDQMDARAQERKLLDQVVKYWRKKVHFHVIAASDIQRKGMFLPAQPLFGGQGCL